MHQQKERYTALRDVIARGTRRFGSQAVAALSGKSLLRSGADFPAEEDFYALQDVSFEIRRGDTVGIIGRNGAGKSTLLKILSRITEPTRGRVEITGRVSSLLEVGTGFHPELTGRENIYLNGVIMGMGRAEITRKFDEIVAFAEVEKFLDTPVKRYSSGMYVRLAFAVTAHLEPEILIIDEVLAVGDAQFQKKCMGKMEEVGREGRTVLFVSHNMASVMNLCSRGIVLESGRVKADLDVSGAIEVYSAATENSQSEVLPDISPLKPQFKSIRLESDHCNFGENIEINVELTSPYDVDAGIEIEVHDERGMAIVYTSTAPMAATLVSIQAGRENSYKLTLGPLNLATGSYVLYFWLIKPWAENYHIVRQGLKFSVEFSDPCATGFEFRQSYARGAFAVPLKVE